MNCLKAIASLITIVNNCNHAGNKSSSMIYFSSGPKTSNRLPDKRTGKIYSRVTFYTYSLPSPAAIGAEKMTVSFSHGSSPLRADP
jgi:hypothetical protein